METALRSSSRDCSALRVSTRVYPCYTDGRAAIVMTTYPARKPHNAPGYGCRLVSHHDCVKGALYRIWCGVNRLGDSGVKVV